MLRLRRALALVGVVSSSACLALASCSDEPGATPPSPDAGADRTAPPEEEPTLDAAPDGRIVPRPIPPIPPCLGASLPLDTSGEQGFVRVDMGNEAGVNESKFLLDFGANGSTIDLGSFSRPPVPTSCNGDAAAPGAYCQFPTFDFFGPWGTVGLGTADYSFLFGAVRQAGIIGTDFFAVYTFTLDYVGRRIWRAKKEDFCTDAQMIGAGYTPLPAGGFYTNDTRTLRPLSDVITSGDASTAGLTVPNIPTVPITVAGVSALAQIDTGYDDRLYRHSININDALLTRLLADKPGLLTRAPERDLFLTTCIPGLSQAGFAYVLAPGTEVNFISEGGALGRRDVGTIVFVKQPLPQAERCGGIETWTVPAGQLGASFMVDSYIAVFDPHRSRVWLPK